jgi:hypothetical protein
LAKKISEFEKTSEADSTPAAVLDDALSPMFATDEQAAVVAGITTHQLYLLRRRGGGPPFVQHGARIRYPIDSLRAWAAELPRFTSRAEAYAHDPRRARAAAKQRTATAQARRSRHSKDSAETGKGGSAS